MTKQRKARATRKGRKRFVKLCYDKRKAIKWRKKTFPFQGEGLREGGGVGWFSLALSFSILAPHPIFTSWIDIKSAWHLSAVKGSKLPGR